MPNRHPIFDYFEYNQNKDKSYCKVVDCAYHAKGKHANNLCKHIDGKHKELRDELKEKKLQFSVAKNKSINCVQKQYVSVKIERSELLMGCLELTTIDGRPFTILDDSGLQRILRPIIDELRSNGVSVPLNPEHIKRKANEMQEIVKGRIRSEMKGKLPSVQLDLTRHLQRSILGVNVQYFVDDKLVVRTLAMKRTLEQKTGLNLANEVRNILGQFDVDIDNLYTVTTDNGANVLACTSTLQIFQERFLEDYLTSCEGGRIDQNYVDYLMEIESLRIKQGQPFLHEVNCCVHILQLAMGDVLSQEPMKSIVPACRALVVELKTPNVHDLLVRRQLKKPILDCDVRWSSVFGMVGSPFRFGYVILTWFHLKYAREHSLI